MLVIVACLISTPASCTSFTIPTEARLPMQCNTAMVEWALSHPAWSVNRWRCGRIERNA